MPKGLHVFSNSECTVARIVIVEDDDTDRLRLQAILELAGHEIYLTQDLEQVLTYARDGVDVVITDLQMPDLHGLELIMTLRSRTPEVAVIVVSGTGPEQLDMAVAIGAIASFRKPVEPAKLLDAVQRAAGGGQS